MSRGFQKSGKKAQKSRKARKAENQEKTLSTDGVEQGLKGPPGPVLAPQDSEERGAGGPVPTDTLSMYRGL